MKINYGLVIAEKDPTAYVLGKANELPKIVLQADGQWDNFLPVYESQADKFETCGCVVFGTQNCIEVYLKRLTGIEYNFSERFNYNIASISCPGSDPHFVCETIRANNVINQDIMPMTDTIENFNIPRPMSIEYITLGLKWPYSFCHEWVVQGVDRMWKSKMKETLRYSPLAVAVFAWKKQGGLYVRTVGGRDNHWVMIYGYKEGEYWKCFDSYDQSEKRLAWDFNFQFIKRFHISEKIEMINKICVHNSGGIGDNPLALSSHLTVESINLAHKKRGFNLSEMNYYVGYNFLLFPDGRLLQTRLIGEQTAAAVGSNFDTVHICLLGNFTKGSMESPTGAQKEALKGLILNLENGSFANLYKVKNGASCDFNRTRVYAHRELQPTTSCFGSSLPDAWARDLVGPVAEETELQKLLVTLLDLYKKLLQLLQSKPFGVARNDCSQTDVRG